MKVTYLKFIHLLSLCTLFVFQNTGFGQIPPIIEWQKCLGGSSQEQAYSIQQTSDGGYVTAGYSWSNDGDVTGNHGGWDYWVVRLTLTGTLEWQKSLGGSVLYSSNF